MKKIFFLITMLICGVVFDLNAQTFKYTGVLLSRGDLDALKAHIDKGEYPWVGSYNNLKNSYPSTFSKSGPFALVSRNPDIKLGEWRRDMMAIHALALRWYIEKNEACAIKARDILIAWATTQTEFSGMEADLDLGDYCYAFGDGAAILRDTWPGWTADNTQKVKNLFQVYWNAAGCGRNCLGPSNKGTLAMAAGAVCAAFSQDADKLKKIIWFVQTSASAGFPNTLSNGEVGETNRDAGHGNGDWGNLAVTAEVLWRQGVDIYSYLDNRILAAAEYHVKKNSGYVMPYINYGTIDCYYSWGSGAASWTDNRYFYAFAYNAYVSRKKIKAPWLSQYNISGTIKQEQFMYNRSIGTDTTTAVPLQTYPFPTTGLIGEGSLQGKDIGGVSPAGAGSCTYADNAWTVKGGGTGVWTHGADNTYFAYKEVSGDFCFTARVDSLPGSEWGAHVGIMMRNSLDASASQRAWIGTTGYEGEGYFHGWGEMYGGANWESWPQRNTKNWLGTPTYWVKIQRLGNMVTTYYSPDGVSWAASIQAAYWWSGKTYVGLMVCAKTNAKLCRAYFSNVMVTGGTGGMQTRPTPPLTLLSSVIDTQVHLRWSESFGADTYTVYRATDGPNGNYIPIAKGSNPSFIDTQRISGLTYYYKLTATNATGESVATSIETVVMAGKAKSLENGVYTIYVVNANKALSVKDNSTAEGAAIIQTSPVSGNTAQQWQLTHLSGNEYRLTNVKSNKNIDVLGNSTANAAQLQQSTPNDTDNSQIWTITNVGNSYSIIGKASGKGMNVPGGSSADGVVLALWPYAGDHNERFIFTPLNSKVVLSTDSFDVTTELVRYSSNRDGKIRLVLLKSTAPAPNVNDMLLGTTQAISSQNVSCSANVELATLFSGLEYNTSYTVYGILTDNSATNALSAVASVSFITSDYKINVTSSSSTTTTANLDLQTNVNGTLYYMLLHKTDAAPANAQAIIQPQSSLTSGSTNCNVNETYTFSFPELGENTAYMVYMVLQKDGINSSIYSYEFTTKSSTGINTELEDKSLQLYPNPASDNVKIAYMLDKKSRVIGELFSSEGKKLHLIDNLTFDAGTYTKTLDVSQFKDGIYFYQLRIDNQIITKKLMIKH